MPDIHTTDEPLLKPQDIAKILNYDVRTVQRMCRANELPHLVIAGRLRFRRRSIDRWIEQQEKLPETRAQVYGFKGSLRRAAR